MVFKLFRNLSQAPDKGLLCGVNENTENNSYKKAQSLYYSPIILLLIRLIGFFLLVND